MDLFGVADAQPTPKPVAELGDASATWSDPPRGGGLCGLCVKEIHANPGGSHPLRATKRRRAATSDLLLCPVHAQDLREKDDAAKAQRRERQRAEGAGSAPSKRKRREHA